MSRTKGSKNLTAEQLIRKGENIQQIGVHKKAVEILKEDSSLLKNTTNNNVNKVGVGSRVTSTTKANGDSSMVAEGGMVIDNPTNEQLASMGAAIRRLPQGLLNNPQPPQLQSPNKQ